MINQFGDAEMQDTCETCLLIIRINICIDSRAYINYDLIVARAFKILVYHDIEYDYHQHSIHI